MTAMELTGRTILITRPQPGAAETAARIVRCGGTPLLAPVLRVAPVEDERPFAAAMAALETFDGVLLTSANSAKAFVTALPRGGKVPRLFAVGKKTAHILEQNGWNVTVPDQPEGGAALGRAVLEWSPLGRKFLFPRAEEGREELIRVLEEAGKEVVMITVYRMEPLANLPEEVVAHWARVDAIPFFSPRTVEVCLALMARAGLAFPEQAVIAALSPLTAQALRQHGHVPAVIASRPDSDGMLDSLAAWWRGQAGAESSKWPITPSVTSCMNRSTT